MNWQTKQDVLEISIGGCIQLRQVFLFEGGVLVCVNHVFVQTLKKPFFFNQEREALQKQLDEANREAQKYRQQLLKKEQEAEAYRQKLEAMTRLQTNKEAV